MSDFISRQFGRLTVIGFDGIHTTPCGTRKKMWQCKCECGKETVVAENNLKNGTTKSCGCWKRDKLNEHNTVHGGSNDRLYGIWKNTKRRCNSPNDKHYDTYGGRGIKVCEEWNNNYQSFKEWSYANGYDDSAEFQECTLDRIDNNGDYEPSNCRWVDRITQANNTSKNHYVELNGIKMTIAEFARTMNISKNHAWYYIDKFEREVMVDNSLIKRQDAVNEIHKYFVEEIDKTPTEIDEDGDEVYTDMPTVNSLLACNKELSKRIKSLPSAEPHYTCCNGCVHYDQQQTALICRDCKRSYRDMYKE